MITEKVNIRITRVRRSLPLLPLPEIQTLGSSGYDLQADIEVPLTLLPGERVLVPTGIAVSVPPGFEAQIRPRSGLAMKHGVTIANAPGTVDSDYRGEIKVILINLGQTAFMVQRSDRIAQLVIQKIFHIHWNEVEALDTTERATGGFGHTGVHLPTP